MKRVKTYDDMLGGIMGVLGKINTCQKVSLDAGKLTPDAVSEQIQVKTETIVNGKPAASTKLAAGARPLNVILFGPPASGKGTQAAFLKKKYNLVHISTGDLLREETKKNTPEALKLKEIMNSGGLVPDDTVIELVKQELAKPETKQYGWLLDGFPRTPAQAEKLFGNAAPGALPDLVVLMSVATEVLKDRIIYRRIDPQTKEVYNIKKDKNIPEEVQKRLIQRGDDTEEVCT